MSAPPVITVDFETHPIKSRPHYPPPPVGVSIKWPGQPSRYYAALHPTRNNSTPNDIIAALEKVWASGLPVLFHNAKFDLAVCYEVLKLPRLPWHRVHDTMFLAYLCDPHARKIGLKELAEDLLGWFPEERDELADWIIGRKAQLVKAYPANRKVNKKTGNPVDNIAPSDVGAWIWATPGDLAGKYACGDTDRTEALFNHLWPLVQDYGMATAYDRERRLLPLLMENEEQGMRVDMPLLEREIDEYSAALEKTETWLRKELRASGLNFDADRDVASVLRQRGIVPDENWATTKSGQLSVSKDNLIPEHFTGPNGAKIASAMGYRNRLKTCLSMFMVPWYEQARHNHGYITTNWNQTKGDRGGTRTGRPSTNKHNFLNISKDFESKRDDGYVHPAFLSVPNLPLVRKYVLPDEGDVFLHRDFDGQEMRVFADFEQGDLWERFNANPELDPHAFVGEEVQRVAQREIERTKVKTLNFQGLYGGGVPALQAKLRCTVAEAKQLKEFHNKALPGRVILNEVIKSIVLRGEPIRTWGGRIYFPERPGPDGRSKIYKLINYAIQGSAADLTKEALVQWYESKMPGSRFLVTVYDELDLSVPKENWKEHMRHLKDVMEAPRLTVPMRSSGKVGTSWGNLEKCE